MTTNNAVTFQEKTSRFWILSLVTEVRSDGVYVRLAPIERAFRRLEFGAIDSVRVVEYSPTTYQGWHWGLHRTSTGHLVYRLRGNRGVEITRQDGTRWFVGLSRPDELCASVDQLVGPDE